MIVKSHLIVFFFHYKDNVSKDLAMNRSAWRLAINVPEP
jgi:hypothetical protein